MELHNFLWTWLLSLSLMILRFIHGAHINPSFHLRERLEWISTLSKVTQLSSDWYLGLLMASPIFFHFSMLPPSKVAAETTPLPSPLTGPLSTLLSRLAASCRSVAAAWNESLTAAITRKKPCKSANSNRGQMGQFLYVGSTQSMP